MAVEVISRTEMEKRLVTIDKHTPIISINDVGYASPVPNSMPSVIRLYFDDVTPYTAKHKLCHPYYIEQANKRSFKLFTDEMAEVVVSFIIMEKIKARTLGKPFKMLIHCYAGVSRSAAVGMFYKCFLSDTGSDLIGVDLDNARFNVHVFSKLVEAYDEMKGELQ